MSKQSQLSLFEQELAGALEDARGYGDIRLISEQLYTAGFRYVSVHARIVSKFEWEQMTSAPFVGEHEREQNCGWCNDTGMAPWVVGDYLRTCKLCDAGKKMRELGYGINPFRPATISKEEAENVLGPLTDDEYARTLERYQKIRMEEL